MRTKSKKPGRRRGPVAYNPVDVYVGTRLRAQRVQEGLSQEELADAIGITFQQLQKYESGQNRISASRLYDLSQVLGVDLNYFVDGMDEATQRKSPAQIHRGKSTQSVERAINQHDDPHSRREMLELIKAYNDIQDPKTRALVRNMIRRLSTGSNDT